MGASTGPTLAAFANNFHFVLFVINFHFGVIEQARKLQATLVRNYHRLTDGGEV